MDDTRIVKEEDKKEKNNYSRNQDQDQNLNSLRPAVMKVRNGENETCKTSSWKQKDFCSTKKEDLESTKAEMGQVMEENKRLKSDLDQIMNDYQSLQMRFHEFTRKQQESKTLLEGAENNNIDPTVAQQPEVEDTHELSLSLGRNPNLDSKNKITCSELNITPQETLKERSSSGLSLALDYKDEGATKPTNAENSLDEAKDEAGETWPPSKVLKTMKSGDRDEDVVQQPSVKKARVSVRARCDTPTMNDGCQWRKYGQKIAKGNPCPRAYYRCTVAPSCPVRKQVQRCADDMSILITTYEGTHNHPLPISATAMASTTSAAAYMLISGSSTSNSTGVGSSTSSTTTLTNLASNSNFNFPGLNLNMTDNTSRSRPLYFPNSSFSPSPSQPTITLDLTTSSTSSASTSSQFSKLASTNFAPRAYPTTTNLTFNSLDLSNPNPNGNNLPMSWPPSGLFSYNTTNPQTFNKTQPGPAPISSSRDQESFYQTLFQKFNPNPSSNLVLTHNSSNKQQQPQSSIDTVAAAAKAITSDPSFQSVLTAALSSLISANNNANDSGIVNVGASAIDPNVRVCHTSEIPNMVNWGKQSSSTTPNLLQPTNDGGVKGNINRCASSLLSMASNNTTNAQAGNLMVLSSPLPFSASSKSTSSSPGDSRDNSS
ncbi:hypothetical protein V2J09_016889 [Rumex salicifolius]